MSAISSEEIISILKEEIENYDAVCKDQEVETVIWVGGWDCNGLWNRSRHVRGRS